jgi:Protein of unknown function (DUF3833)
VKLSAPLGLAAFVAISASNAAEPDPKLDMIDFFSGRTRADNVIKIPLHRPHKVIVDSTGGRNKGGDFVLIDDVQEEGKSPRKRTWVMHPVAPGHFTGSLSDAKGPVDVVVSGGGATIRYTMKEGGLRIDQQVQLQPNGTLANHVIARKFGIRFAELNGTIHKLD